MVKKFHINKRVIIISTISVIVLFCIGLYLNFYFSPENRYDRWLHNTYSSLKKQEKICKLISIKGHVDNRFSLPYFGGSCNPLDDISSTYIYESQQWYDVYYMLDGKKQFQVGVENNMIKTSLIEDCSKNQKPYVKFLKIDKDIPIPESIYKDLDNANSYYGIEKETKYFEIHVPPDYKIDMTS